MTEFDTISEAEEYAISLAKKSEPEDSRPHPLVSAIVIDKELRLIAEAHRNEVAEGHAEYNLFEHKHTGEPFDPDDLLLVTLEPCSSRSSEKTPCAVRVVDSGIQNVRVGLLDPNPVISGKGVLLLQESGIEVSLFSGESQQQLLAINKAFWLSHRLPMDELAHDQLLTQSLDEWYDLVNRLYWSRNYRVSEMEILGHLVEVIGGLSLLASDKSKPGIERSAFVPKAIGWWLALCGRMGVRSPEALLYAKYPGACPYCRKTQHDDDICLTMKAESEGVPEWQVLGEMAQAGWDERPTRISEWQQQFGKIYQTFQGQQYDYVFARLSEELGELAEAVRVFKSNPYYFISEASDVFAWLMKLQNLFEYNKGVASTDRGLALEERLAAEYPGYCTKCWGTRCHCPPLLPSTIGRTAKDVKGLAPDQIYLAADKLNLRFGQVSDA